MASRATFIFFVVFVCATGAAEGIDVGNALTLDFLKLQSMQK